MKDAIVARVLETGNGYLVDREFGLGLGTAKEICRKYGVDYPKSTGRKKENLTHEQYLAKHPEWKDIEALSLSGSTQEEIAQRFGLSAPSIGYVLGVLGLGTGKGSKSHKTKKAIPANFVDLYRSGLSCKEIGKLCGASSGLIRKRLIRENVQLRVGKASGDKNPQWKGGQVETMHYYRRQCYEVSAICLGKPVPRGYIIHHVDENPKNNNPRNLILFPSQKHHARFHQKVLSLRIPADSEEAILVALEIGGVPLPEPKNPIEL
jgi:transposase